MRSRLFLLITASTIMMLSLIAGATMAWLNDYVSHAEKVEGEGALDFSAGTFIISSNGEGEHQIRGETGESFTGIIPGDEEKLTTTLVNEGSLEMAVKLDDVRARWQGEGKAGDEVSLELAGESAEEWRLEKDGDCLEEYTFFYEEPLAAGEEVEISLKIAFDQEELGEEFEDSEFELSGILHFIQAAQNAPEKEWGLELEEVR